ncbi:thioredoxin-like protein [Catenaria anguillulae PL171]|uniref:Thioredoxin-like protein n=1 Tax=Catenaria anguillulae PL171 TaxID=765915 RepID=A0A1Y2I236_9FUNG|nr:thioredoxin-like protein [Catenaria anguillulae PL171]
MKFSLALRLFTSLLAFAFSAKLAHGFFGANAGISHLTQSTYHAQVMDTEQTTVVMYYAPWCGYCQKMKPDFATASRKLKGIVKFAAVNCDEEKQVCAEAGVQGFPVVKGYYTNAKSKKRITIEYQGDRTAQSLVSFGQDRIPNFVKNIRSTPTAAGPSITLDKFYSLENSTLPKIVVVKPASRAQKPTSSLLKALAIDYHYRLLIGEATGASDDDAVYTDFGGKAPAPKAMPDVYAVIPGQAEAVKYTGEIKQKPLREFFDRFALKKKIRPSRKKGKAAKKVEEQKAKLGNVRDEL